MRQLKIATKYIATIERLSTRSLMVGEARRKGIKEFGAKINTVLLRDVFSDKGSYVTSHQWIDNEYGIKEDDVGKTIEFEATITPYIKHINTKMVRDFKLSKLTNISIGD